ncbi:MAG: CoB--CoM heterodisulfide reductase iron-sulfur subunit A family protein [Thermoplasmata archaeon]
MGEEDKVGAVLVVGGGIASMQASLDLAESGFKVYLLEKSSSIGGVMSQLDKTFPTNDCAMCTMAPKLVDTGRHRNITLISNARVKNIEGDPGRFDVTITVQPRYIDEEKCTGCGLCATFCPLEAVNEYDRGLGIRNVVFVKYPQAIPLVFIIDIERCIGCGLCEKICKAKAIDYDQQSREINIEVGSVILAPGFEEFQAELKSEYGYGIYPNVITSLEFERILSASGPFGGTVIRPSDGEVPKRIAFISCVGSRDPHGGMGYCSSVCCMFSTKEAFVAKEHAPGLEAHVFYMDMRAFGKEFDDYFHRARDEYGVKYTRCRIADVEEKIGTNNLLITYREENGELKQEEFDMVVLAAGLRSPSDAEELAGTFGFQLNEDGFCATKRFFPLDTTRKGIYVCGAFSAPKDIPDSVAQASGAAVRASAILSSERNRLTAVEEFPVERDVISEEPRIGVFVCHCGINIGGVVSVPEAADYAKTLPNVVYAEHNLYTCSQDTQERIKEKIKEHNLNRVIVASCTPRTHEPLFRRTVREAGLNQYLFEMANIRDQCSWIHMHEKKKATKKAKDLIRMAVAKTSLLQPLHKEPLNVDHAGLVIGGGLSGMTAALELANQGFKVHLIEREKKLGGNLNRLHYLLEGEDPRKRLNDLIGEVEAHENINLYLGSEIENIDGYVGGYKTTIMKDGKEELLEHGIIIVATGGYEHSPKEYLYGEDKRVLTQLELEKKIVEGEFSGNTVVMIQCVGSRDHEHSHCSRLCCTHAVKNALKIKKIDPSVKVYVLYRDIRTYGFAENWYREARRKGVFFIRYEDEEKPEVVKEGKSIKVSVVDPILKKKLIFRPDILVLSAGIYPYPENEELAKMLKVPLNKDGFFLEAHMKLRPVDFATEGVFLCGLAHSPKFVDESISQAMGAASRATTILSKETIEAEGLPSVVDREKCSGCGTCEIVCPYGAIVKDEEGKANVTEVLCKGCGSCRASCPERAITAPHFTLNQIVAEIKAMAQKEAV